jgi:L-lysine exporter family protein LysE/ArgO
MLSIVIATAKGFGLGASLIIAIGAQNAFVLRQGLARQRVFLVAGLCSLCDAALIALGAGGFAALITAEPLLVVAAAWGGALFLLAYGGRAFHAALSPGRLQAAGNQKRGTLWAVAATTLAVSLLNPHVYLDTVILVGSVAAQFPPGERMAFALGAVGASFVWFYGLGYGAAWLAPLFAKPAAWRILDLAIGIVMWAIAAALIWDRLTV